MSNILTKMKQFNSLIQLLDTFKTDAICREYLAEQRWPAGVACVHCGNMKVYTTTRKKKDGEVVKEYKCAAKECHKKFSVTVGTIFENTNIGLRHWFAAVYLATAHKKGISSLQLSRDLNITQKTAWFMLHRIRESMREKAPQVLDGMVEMDETYIGGKRSNKPLKERKRLAELRTADDKTPVFGMKDRDGKIIAMSVDAVTANELYPIINASVEKGTTIITDGHPIYKKLANADNRYTHESVDHSKDEYVRGDFHTNGIEGFWSMLKRGIIGIYHQVSVKHLDRYCDEFAYRANTNKVPDSVRFTQSLARVEGRLTYADLIKK